MAVTLTSEEIRLYLKGREISASDINKGTGLNISGMNRFLKNQDRDISLASRKLLTKWIENGCDNTVLDVARKKKVLKKIEKLIMNEL